MKNKKKRLDWSEVWREASEIIWSHRRRVVLGLALVIVSRSFGFVLPASSKILIDEVIKNERTELLFWLAMAAGVATLIQAATSFALSQILSVAAQRAIAEMRKRVAQHILRLPMAYFDSTKSGALVSRIMTDPEGIRNLVGTGLVQMTGGVFSATVALAVLFWLNWRMTSFTILLLGVFAACMAFSFSKLRPIFRARGKINAEVMGRLSESLGGIRVVKAYTAEKREDIIFAEGVHKLFRNIASSITGVSAITAVTTAIIGVIGMVVMLFGGNAVVNGTMTEGDLFMYIIFVGLVTMPLVQMASIGTQFSEAFAGLDRIREILNTPAEGADDDRRHTLDAPAGCIAFENVCFEYEEGVPVLKDISFEAAAGSTTALVGSSGSGKSTLIGLIMAFHRPTSGRVSIDGIDFEALALRDYRAHLGVVLQENFLFAGTIAQNISYARPHAPRAEVERAGRIAHCAEFVERFDDGYDTLIGERGVTLSGGQRQRVAIARAILADPRILILDEATSSLDSESEEHIQDGIKALRAGRTTFVIAHRLSTIRSADQILVIEGGEIVERGTHPELMAIEGRYQELHDKQHKLEENLFVNPGEELNA